MSNDNNSQLRTELRYPHIAARVFDTPLLIQQSKLDTLLHVLGPRLGFDAAPVEVATEAEFASKMEAHMATMQAVDAEFKEEGYFVADGVAVLPVIGTLVQRGDWMTSMSGMVSYGQIERMFAAAMNDKDVRELIIEYDTPGGEAAGAFDTADRLASARGQKPVMAVVSELAASAGYLLASTADEIVIPRTGFAGSIGVVAAHVDYSKALEKRGIAVTHMYAGDKKVDGNPYQPLSERARADWQAEIDEMYKIFVETVARNRSMTPGKVRSTQAGMFMGFKAIDAGLADRVNTLSNELSNAVLRKGGGPLRSMASTGKEAQMSGATTAAPEGTVTLEALNKAVADATEKGKAQGMADGAKAEQERIKGILTHAEAAERTELAQHLAFETSMSVEDAGKMLGKAEKKAAGKSPLDTAMRKTGSPGITSTEMTETTGKKSINTSAIYGKRAEQAQAASKAASAK